MKQYYIHENVRKTSPRELYRRLDPGRAFVSGEYAYGPADDPVGEKDN